MQHDGVKKAPRSCLSMLMSPSLGLSSWLPAHSLSDLQRNTLLGAAHDWLSYEHVHASWRCT